MNFIHKISPRFLKKLDAYLRVNHSWIWTTRIHINLYLAVLLNLFFILLTFIYQTGLKHAVYNGQIDTFFGLLFIPASLFLGLVIYQMSLFNSDKNHASRFKYQEFFLFILFFVNISLPLSIPYTSTAILSERVAHIESEENVESDLTDYAFGQMFFPISLTYYDYCENVEDYKRSLKFKYEYNNSLALERQEWYNYSSLRDSLKARVFNHQGEFREQRPRLYFDYGKMDSYAYFNFGPREYHYYGNWDSQLDPEDKILKAIQRFNINPDRELAKKRIAAFSQLLKKYSYVNEIDEAKVLEDYYSNNYAHSYAYKELNEPIFIARDNLLNINSAHNKRALVWNTQTLRAFLMVAFCITLLFQVFKNVYWSQMLRAALVTGLIFTMLMVVGVLVPHYYDLPLIISAYIPIILLIISFQGFRIKKFSTRYLQVNILLNLILPFFPLLFLEYLDEVHRFYTWSLFDDLREAELRRNPNLNLSSRGLSYETRNEIESWVLWSGIFFYVIVWASYLKALYLRYWSLPKPK